MRVVRQLAIVAVLAGAGFGGWYYFKSGAPGTAGARAPAHDHPGAEECVVLRGSIRYIGGSLLRAGDFEAVAPGGHHAELVSDAGALVFLRYTLPLSRYIPL